MEYNFLKLHSEGKIGYKNLTLADLGLSPTSHQTHIGLFDDILTFLPNSVDIDDAIFVYNNETIPTFCRFARIENPNQTYRSPKISIGERGSVSVVSLIRNCAKENKNTQWYLFWFGLESEQVVFFLFNSQSSTFNDIVKLGINLHPNIKGRIEKTDTCFNSLINYLEKFINEVSVPELEQLEVSSLLGIQNNNLSKNRRFRRYDIDRAKGFFNQIGRDGEKLIDIFLKEQLDKKLITNYEWFNRDKESGFPYDFTIQDLHQNVTHIDVKSTMYKFEQKIIFSRQEVEFIQNTPNYNIYRVYNLSSDKGLLRICKNSLNYAKNLNFQINSFDNNISKLNTELYSASFAISPQNTFFMFDTKEFSIKGVNIL